MTWQWSRLRNVKIKNDPICEYCGEEVAMEVDHEETRTDNPEREFDYDNLKSACVKCHDYKTAQENKVRNAELAAARRRKLQPLPDGSLPYKRIPLT